MLPESISLGLRTVSGLAEATSLGLRTVSGLLESISLAWRTVNLLVSGDLFDPAALAEWIGADEFLDACVHRRE